MRIDAPKIILRNNELVYTVQVHFANNLEVLWYSVDAKYADIVSNRSDAALLGLLIPAMAKAEDIYIDGEISEKLYFNLSGRYQTILKSIIPSLQIVKIYPSLIKSSNEQASGVATGFSAGVDSFSVLADHFYSSSLPGYQVTHLLFNNVGSHGKGSKGHDVFKKSYASLKEHADKTGLPFVYVDSNLDSFYKGLGFQQTHTPRNTSVALLLQKGIGKYLYASTFGYNNIFVGKTYDMAYSDAITLPLMSTEVLDAVSVGSEYSRVEKTLMVAELEASYNALDVCVNPNGSTFRNCSTCWKCKRTLLTFEIAGVIDRYKNVFDLKAYQNGNTRSNFIAEVISSKDPLLNEIVTYSRNQNYRLPFYSHVLAKTGIPSLVKGLKKVKRKFSQNK